LNKTAIENNTQEIVWESLTIQFSSGVNPNDKENFTLSQEEVRDEFVFAHLNANI